MKLDSFQVGEHIQSTGTETLALRSFWMLSHVSPHLAIPLGLL
jgi:hypothetical protein